MQMHARMLADALRPRNLHRILVPALKYLVVAAFVPGVISAMIAASIRSDAYHSALTCKKPPLADTSGILTAIVRPRPLHTPIPLVHGRSRASPDSFKAQGAAVECQRTGE